MAECCAILYLYFAKAIMDKIIRPASQVKQGDLILYATSLKVSDLLLQEPEFYSIERLDPNNPQAGYQRLLNENRAKKLADYIVDGLVKRDAFLPTSIFMATDKDIPFNSSNNTIEIDRKAICPFSIVDGQHRVEGLRMAVLKNKQVEEFEIPVNIAVKLDHLSQMAHFLIVNTTQKSVDEGIAQRIRARISEAIGIEPLATLPRWIRRLVETGDDVKILQLIDYLNAESSSPWQNRIFMANEEGKKGNRVSQTTFATLMKRHYFVQNNPVFAYDENKQKAILLNYWKAISNIIGIGDSVLFKYNGVLLFLMFSVAFFHKMVSINDGFHVDKMQGELQKCFDIAEDEAVGIGHADFWKTSGKIAGLNTGAVSKVCHKLFSALGRSSSFGGGA